MKMLNENWLLNVAKEGLGLTMRDEDKADILNRIKEFIREHKIPEDKYTINDDLSVSVEGNIVIYTSDVVDGHLPFKFEKVTGNFYCSYIDNLTSLEGSPQEVMGNFYCNNNKLTSFKGGPQKVGKNFRCYNNTQLTSLEGCPQTVGENFYCSDNKKQLTEDEVRQHCQVGKEIHVHYV